MSGAKAPDLPGISNFKLKTPGHDLRTKLVLLCDHQDNLEHLLVPVLSLLLLYGPRTLKTCFVDFIE
jgi:hypothetical protein